MPVTVAFDDRNRYRAALKCFCAKFVKVVLDAIEVDLGPHVSVCREKLRKHRFVMTFYD